MIHWNKAQAKRWVRENKQVKAKVLKDSASSTVKVTAKQRK
jgi:hypothetical protein